MQAGRQVPVYRVTGNRAQRLKSNFDNLVGNEWKVIHRRAAEGKCKPVSRWMRDVEKSEEHRMDRKRRIRPFNTSSRVDSHHHAPETATV